MYDVLKLCERVDGKEVSADPGVFFPATISAIQSGDFDLGADKEVNKRFADNAKRIKPEAFDLALRPFSDFAEMEASEFLISARAEALAFAESYFSRALSQAVGGAVRLHIIKNDDWKR